MSQNETMTRNDLLVSIKGLKAQYIAEGFTAPKFSVCVPTQDLEIQIEVAKKELARLCNLRYAEEKRVAKASHKGEGRELKVIARGIKHLEAKEKRQARLVEKDLSVVSRLAPYMAPTILTEEELVQAVEECREMDIQLQLMENDPGAAEKYEELLEGQDELVERIKQAEDFYTHRQNRTCWVGEYLASKCEPTIEYLAAQQLGFSEAQVDDLTEQMFGTNLTKIQEKWDKLRKSQKLTGRGRARAFGYKGQYIIKVENPKKGNTEAIRVWFDKNVGPRSLIEALYGDKYALPVIQLVNQLRLDEKGRRPDLPSKVWQAAYQAGYTLVKDKWLVRNEIMEDIQKTLPTDIDIRGYINGLCAPMIHVGKYEVTFVTRTALVEGWKETVNGLLKTLIQIPAGVDGAGGIHPLHPLWDAMGIPLGSRNWIQFRAWDPKTGVLAKGLLVADERCINPDGSPAIYCDWLQVKGTWKERAKKRAKGMGDPKNMTLHVGVMQSFDKEGDQHGNAQMLQFMEDSPENHVRVDTWLNEFYGELSLEKILKGICRKDELVRNAVALCKACGVDPLTNLLVQNAINEKLSRLLYRASQGAGLKGYRYGVVMDASLKPGEVVMAPIKTKMGWKFRVGSEIAYSRAPGLAPGALSTLVVVEPKPHMLIDIRGELRVPQYTIFVHPYEAHATQLDDDGDTVVCWDDPEVLAAFKTRIPVVGFGGPNDVYLVEPEKGGADVIGGHPWGSFEWRQFVSEKGKGPIGIGTLISQMWLALDQPGEYMASLLWCQSAVDQEKRASKLADPDVAKNPANWTVVMEYDRMTKAGPAKVQCWKYTPPEGKGWLSARDWVTDEDGLLDVMKVKKYIQSRTAKAGFVLGHDQKGRPIGPDWSMVLSWRQEQKRIDPANWFEPEYTGLSQNLVHYCARKAWELYQDWAKENIPPRSEKRVTQMLWDALGQEMAPLPEKVYMIGLRQKAGVSAYRETVAKIMDRMGEEVDKEAVFLAAESEFHQSLSALTMEEILQIWATELMLANQYASNPRERDTHLKLAFQAVTFPGSPVMAKLGIEDVEKECEFMTPSRLKATQEWAQRLLGEVRADGTPVFKDIHEALSRMVYGPYGKIEGTRIEIPEPHYHEELTGVAFSRCPVCQGKILAMSVRISRSSPNEVMLNYAKGVLSKMSAALK